MRMKPFSPRRKPVSHAAVRNALIVNQLATPGLGSLIAGRWLAGTGQFILALTGCVMLLVWFLKVIIRYYGLMFGEEQPNPAGWIGEWGAILFAASWFWAAVTSFSLLREASRNSLESLESFETEHISPPVLDLSGKPPKQP
jgi:hypothetical protein